MSSPHIRRLEADYDKLKTLALRCPFMQILSTEGNPPHAYELRLTCKAVLRLDGSGLPVIGEDHRLAVSLPPDYPRGRPSFMFRSPIFHPNVHTNGQVCYGNDGDHGFAPCMGLDDLIVRIMDIIRYKNFNPSSAYRLDAAQWAVANSHILPIDKRQLIHEDVLSDIIILDEIRDDDDLSITIL